MLIVFFFFCPSSKFSISTSKILSADPALSNLLDLEMNSSITDVASKLRDIAVDEWCEDPEEYQGFLGIPKVYLITIILLLQ